VVVIRFSVFEDKVRSGEKKQTIRPFEDYRHLKVGNKVHCYSTEKREGVKRPVLKELLYVGVCTEIIAPILYKDFMLDDQIAKLDGFKDAEDMRQWFLKQYPDLNLYKIFRIIRWR